LEIGNWKLEILVETTVSTIVFHSPHSGHLPNQPEDS